MSFFKHKKRILLLRNVIWAGVILVLCLMPSENIPNPRLGIPYLDKVVHFGMFFILAILLCHEMEFQTHLSLKGIYISVILICAAYGGLIEILQDKFFHRTGDWDDLLADVVGGGVGCICYMPIKRLKRRIFGQEKV